MSVESPSTTRIMNNTIPTTTAQPSTASQPMPQTLEEMYKTLENGVRMLIHLAETGAQMPSKDFMFLYSVCYNACTKHGSNTLYRRYIAVLDHHLRHSVIPQFQNMAAVGSATGGGGGLPPGAGGPAEDSVSESLRQLMALIAYWEKYKKAIKSIASMFAYLDRHYLQVEKLPVLYETGLDRFRENIVEPLMPIIRHTLNAKIDCYRQNPTIDLSAIKPVTAFLLDASRNMFLYHDFENIFFRSSRAYFTRERDRLTPDQIKSEAYAPWVKSIIDRERSLTPILHQSTEEILLATADQIFKGAR